MAREPVDLWKYIPTSSSSVSDMVGGVSRNIYRCCTVSTICWRFVRSKGTACKIQQLKLLTSSYATAQARIETSLLAYAQPSGTCHICCGGNNTLNVLQEQHQLQTQVQIQLQLYIFCSSYAPASLFLAGDATKNSTLNFGRFSAWATATGWTLSA